MAFQFVSAIEEHDKMLTVSALFSSKIQTSCLENTSLRLGFQIGMIGAPNQLIPIPVCFDWHASTTSKLNHLAFCKDLVDSFYLSLSMKQQEFIFFRGRE